MLGIIAVVTFHPGGVFALRVGQFAPLFGAFLGGSLVLSSISLPQSLSQAPAGRQRLVERLSWLCIGLGMMAWGIGDSFWRYFVSLGQAPFPSLADMGYVAFTILVFVGLLLQPSSNIKGRRLMLIMDSMIATGSLLTIAWVLLLGPLALTPSEGGLAKFLGLYYPISDTILLSCVIFLLLRWRGPVQQSAAYGISLFIVGIGLCFFVFSDFLFNIEQNAGTYVEATWVDLGWPLGLMTIGVAALLRRFPIQIPDVFLTYIQQKVKQTTLSPPQYMPYGLFGCLLAAFTYNVISLDPLQQSIRPVLLLASLAVVSLVIVRQIVTLQENLRLVQMQTLALQQLQEANEHLEVQTRQIAEQNVELEQGIEHLKAVLAHLANGHLQVRATLTRGILWPLAASLNILAERLSDFGQDTRYAQHLMKTLGELSAALTPGKPLHIPAPCYDFPELSSFITALQRWNASTSFPPRPSPPPTAGPRLPTSRPSGP
jgi:hypothetical protein